MQNILIKNASVYGAAEHPEAAVRDILIQNGKIHAISENIPAPAGATIIDATGLIAAPGLVDMHVHFRDPHTGDTPAAEDIISGAEAAAAGGFTTCCCMPNPYPAADNAETIGYITQKAKKACIKLLPYGAVTINQKGMELTDFEALRRAGAIALSDDGYTIRDASVMCAALKKAQEQDCLIISHCEDETLARNYAVNEGPVSRKLNLPGRPAIAEEIIAARDIMLAKHTGARLHIAHVSTAGSVELIRKAKSEGIKVTAETCPQYFTLTDEEVMKQGSMARVNPPLRSEEDITGIIKGLADGTIDAIATDHAPHTQAAKSLPLADAPSGMIGLETALALTLTLYHKKILSITKIIELMTINPSRILNIDAGTLTPGKDADIVIFDPYALWTVDPACFKSNSRNTPFAGMKLQGRPVCTISRGEPVGSSI